jgi:hypothetical protein
MPIVKNINLEARHRDLTAHLILKPYYSYTSSPFFYLLVPLRKSPAHGIIRTFFKENSQKWCLSLSDPSA